MKGIRPNQQKSGDSESWPEDQRKNHVGCGGPHGVLQLLRDLQAPSALAVGARSFRNVYKPLIAKWDSMKTTPQKPNNPTPADSAENRDKQQPKAPEQPEGGIPISYQWLKQSLSFTQTGNIVSLLERKLQGMDGEAGGSHD